MKLVRKWEDKKENENGEEVEEEREEVISEQLVDSFKTLKINEKYPANYFSCSFDEVFSSFIIDFSSVNFFNFLKH